MTFFFRQRSRAASLVGLTVFMFMGCRALTPRERELRELEEPDLCDTTEPQVRLVSRTEATPLGPVTCQSVRLIHRGEDARIVWKACKRPKTRRDSTFEYEITYPDPEQAPKELRTSAALAEQIRVAAERAMNRGPLAPGEHGVRLKMPHEGPVEYELESNVSGTCRRLSFREPGEMTSELATAWRLINLAEYCSDHPAPNDADCAAIETDK